MSVSAGTTTIGDQLTAVATVSPPSATGVVTFLDGATVLGTSVLAGGVAMYSTSALPIGDHAIVARYEGDATHPSGITAAQFVEVDKIASTVVLVAPSKVAIGETLTLSATVGPNGSTGTVTFLDGSTILATVPVVNGVASGSVPTATPGTILLYYSHSITARYEGDATHSGSLSTASVVTVSEPAVIPPIVTTTVVSVAPNVIGYGQVSTVTVTVVSNEPGTLPQGSIRLLEGSTMIATALLKSGTASIPLGVFNVNTLDPNGKGGRMEFFPSSLPRVASRERVLSCH